MSVQAISILILAVIFLIATVRSVNLGALAVVAAFLLGVVALDGADVGERTDKIFAGFPGDLFVILVGVTFLFAIAKTNGTVDWLVQAAIRAVGGRVGLIPWVMFLVTACLTAFGAVVPASVAIIAPIGMGFAVRYRINPLMMGLMIINGATAGGFSPISIFGGITNGVVEKAGLPGNPMLLFVASFVFNFVISAVAFFWWGGRELLTRRVEDGDPATVDGIEPDGASAPVLSGGVVAASASGDGVVSTPAPGGGVVSTPVPGGGVVAASAPGGGVVTAPAAGSTAPASAVGVRAEGGSPALKSTALEPPAPESLPLDRDRILTLIGLVGLAVGALFFDLNVGMLAMTVALVLILVSPRSASNAINGVAWPTVLLVCGIVLYVGVMETLGTIDWLGKEVAGIGAPLLAAVIICFIGGAVSAFASTTGILGALIPLAVPFLTGSDAVGAVGLITALAISSSVVDSSPFSTSGALTVANAPEEHREAVYRGLMRWGFSMVLIAPVVTWAVLVVPGWL
jgi:di/tricarboxylate transporter